MQQNDDLVRWHFIFDYFETKIYYDNLFFFKTNKSETSASMSTTSNLSTVSNFVLFVYFILILY